MPTHTITVQESEFKLFQTIRHIELEVPEKESLIGDLVRQIEQWMHTGSLSAREIFDLPLQEKQRLLTAQFQAAEALYREHPDLVSVHFSTLIE